MAKLKSITLSIAGLRNCGQEKHMWQKQNRSTKQHALQCPKMRKNTSSQTSLFEGHARASSFERHFFGIDQQNSSPIGKPITSENF